MKVEHSLVFASGNHLRIWGAVGLDPVGLTARFGYDGDVSEELELTRAEEVELANYMIERWSDYRVEAMRGERGEEKGGEEKGGEEDSSRTREGSRPDEG